MTVYAGMTRRTFLRLLLWLPAAGLNRVTNLVPNTLSSPAIDPIAGRLASFFTNVESAKIVGREYLKCRPKERDIVLLVELICSFRAERRAELAKADVEKRREVLQLQQRQDFERGRVVTVHGWILSETEVRLFALATLIQPDS